MSVESEAGLSLHHVRRGQGRPLLLVHGLGGTWRTWNPILDQLAAEREVIAVDLPGFGSTPPLPRPCTMRSLVPALADFVRQQNLRGIDAVGLSMGGRLVLDMARSTDVLGNIVALAPGGFRRGHRRHAFYFSMTLAITGLRWLNPILPRLTRRPIARSLLLGMLCARPRQVAPQTALEELRGMPKAAAFEEMVFDLAYHDHTPDPPRVESTQKLIIGWGRKDRICWPYQANLALQHFPEASLTWFNQGGHMLHWDLPHEVTQFILRVTEGKCPESQSTTGTKPEE